MIKKVIIVMAALGVISVGGIACTNAQKAPEDKSDVSSEETIKAENSKDEKEHYDTSNINEYLNNDEIEEMQITLATISYEKVKYEDNMQEIIKYLKSLKVEVTDEKPGVNTPTGAIKFVDKNGKSYLIELYGSIANITIDGEYIHKFIRFNNFNDDTLMKLCDEAGLTNPYKKN